MFTHMSKEKILYIYIYQSLNPPQLIITKYSFFAQQIG